MRRAGALDGLLVHLDEDDVGAGAGVHLGDAGAHQPAADDADAGEPVSCGLSHVLILRRCDRGQTSFTRQRLCSSRRRRVAKSWSVQARLTFLISSCRRRTSTGSWLRSGWSRLTSSR